MGYMSWEHVGEVATAAQITGLDTMKLVALIVKGASHARTHKKRCRELLEHLELIGDLLRQVRAIYNIGKKSNSDKASSYASTGITRAHGTHGEFDFEFEEEARMRSMVVSEKLMEKVEDAVRRAVAVVEESKNRSFLYLLALGWTSVSRFRDCQRHIHALLALLPLITLLHASTTHSTTSSCSCSTCTTTNMAACRREDVSAAACSSRSTSGRKRRSVAIIDDDALLIEFLKGAAGCKDPEEEAVVDVNIFARLPHQQISYRTTYSDDVHMQQQQHEVDVDRQILFRGQQQQEICETSRVDLVEEEEESPTGIMDMIYHLWNMSSTTSITGHTSSDRQLGSDLHPDQLYSLHSYDGTTYTSTAATSVSYALIKQLPAVEYLSDAEAKLPLRDIDEHHSFTNFLDNFGLLLNNYKQLEFSEATTTVAAFSDPDVVSHDPIDIEHYSSSWQLTTRDIDDDDDDDSSNSSPPPSITTQDKFVALQVEQQPSTESAVAASMQMIRNNTWHTHLLLDCCMDPYLCMSTCVYPCGTFSDIAAFASDGKVSPQDACDDFMTYSLLLSCFCYTSCYRRKLRQQYDIEGGCFEDLCTHLFCFHCALVQEWSEILHRDEDGLKMSPPQAQKMERHVHVQ